MTYIWTRDGLLEDDFGVGSQPRTPKGTEGREEVVSRLATAAESQGAVWVWVSVAEQWSSRSKLISLHTYQQSNPEGGQTGQV